MSAVSLARSGTVCDQLVLARVGVFLKSLLQKIGIGYDKQRAIGPTVEGKLLLVQGVPNDFTRLYWRSSIGLPMQQLKPGGAGGGWTCTAKRKSTLCG